MAKRVKVPGRLESAETGNIVTGADAVMDDERGKTQVVVNNEVEAAILSLAQNKQNVLTFDSAPTEGSTNPVTSAGVYTADKALSDAIEAILLLIPSAASALNKLVDMQTMNSSIATATASFKGTYNLVSDLHLGVDATHEQIGAALDALSLGADNNDYAFVQVPESDTSEDIKVTQRYKFNGTTWAYEYDLNNSGFTAEQWAAINSGVTSLLVSKLSDLPTNAELTILLAGKQDNLTFDNVPTAGSPNPVKSGGVYARNNEIVALINALDAAKQDVLTFDNAPVEGSTNPVKSGGVYTAISAVQAAIVALDAAKQNALTFDSTPTLGSPNPVTSSGIKIELNRIDGNITTLNDLYEALTQSALVVVQPTDTWPVASPATSTIYRVVDRTNTPPQYYSDYMWNGSAMVLMATYDNAIDPRPKKASQNLVTSGGVFDNMGALDVSELNAMENPHTLAKYVDLSAALAAIPTDYQKGGMSIKFVRSSDNRYVQYRYMGNAVTGNPNPFLDTANWQGIDDVPTAGSSNLVKSGGVKLSQSLFNNLIGANVMQNKAWNGVTGKLIDNNGYSATEVFVYDENAIMSAIPYKAVFFDKDFNFLGQADCQTTFILSPYNDAYYIAFVFYPLYTDVFSYKNKLSSKVLDAKAITPTGATLINNFKGNLSVLGDSISTFNGISPDEYSPYYPEGNVTDVAFMYWSILAKEMAFTIDTINACGHSCVVTGQQDYPSFLDRCTNLGHPRMIIVQGGTNDWNRKIPIGELALWKETENLDTTVFAQAYDKLIRLIKENYPTAYVITLTNRVISDGYNDVIRKVSAYHKVYACVNAHYYSYSDGDMHIHPDTIGMQEIARSIINGLVLGEATYKQSSEIIQLSDEFRVNNMFREVFFVGSTATVARKYKLHTVYIAGTRVAINISDEADNIICSFNDNAILYDNDEQKAKRNSILYLAEANSSGISGYALVDFNYVSHVGQIDDIFFNPRIVTSLPANPGISSYLQNQKLSDKLYDTLISENDVLIQNIKELYVYKKDGTAVDETLTFYLVNLVVIGARRAINIGIKDSEGTETIILDADTSRGENLSGNIITLKEENSSGYEGYIVLSKPINDFSESIPANYSFNNDAILHINCNPIISAHFNALKEFALWKQPLSEYSEINEQIIELYIEGTGVSPSNTYRLLNIYIHETRYALNVSDDNGNIICGFNDYSILDYTNPAMEKLRNSVLPLSEINNSGVHGYIFIDFNKAVSTGVQGGRIINSDRITTLSVNPIIKGYLEDNNIREEFNEKIGGLLISENNSDLRGLVSELYVYKKDGTAIDPSTNIGLTNIYIYNGRRAVNIGVKDSGGTETLILDADTNRGEDLHGVINLKEKNSSGYSGYLVLVKDIYEYPDTNITNKYSFNNAVILNKGKNPIISAYLNIEPVDKTYSLRKEITDKISDCVKSTVADEIAKAKQSTYIDANAQGFLPSNTAAQNVSAMNTLLSNGGVIIVDQPGEYLVNERMLIHSNTTLLFAPGVIIKMASNMSYVFINYAAFYFDTSGYDENIKVIGYHLDTNGFTCTGGIGGLRGFLTFFHAKKVYISDVNCYYYKAHWFFMHLCDWENIEICNVHVFGDKDCIHLGRGKNAFIHNCAICAVDDTIALNAWDFADSNPETGNIENVRIDNIVELPHYFNTSSDYNRTLGFSIRMLNGCWLDWVQGMTVQHSTRVVYNNKIYRVWNLINSSAESTVPPTNGTGSDGIHWGEETSPAVLGCCVKNIYVSNYSTFQRKSEGGFCLSNGINETNHKSWVEGATWVPNENLHFRNIECYGETPAPFLIQEDVKDVTIADSIFDNTLVSNGLFYFKEVFGISPSDFVIPTINLVNNMHKLADNGTYKLSAVNVSGRRDSTNIYTTDEKYGPELVTTVKTADTVVTEQDKVYVV